MRRALLIALAIASLAAPAFGQVNVNGRNPQLPDTLGSLGGLKVECLIGCGGGAVGADVNISGVGGVAVGAGGLPVTFANTTIGISGSVAVTGTFWQATQPVSGTFWQATQPVSGTFWQATQPVSHANFANLDAALSTLATSAKQPALVAGRVPVDGSGVTQPVSGTFWQGTQPVSGTFWQPDAAATRTIASNGAIASITSGGTGTVTVAITGTWVGSLLFFGIDAAGAGNAIYAENDVSGQPETSISANGTWRIPSAGWSSVGVTSTSWTSGTASIALNGGVGTSVVMLGRSLPTGGNIIGALLANQSVNVAQFGGTNVVTGTGASGSGVPRFTVANDSNVLVTPPTLTKGTQGVTGFSVQQLKDAGRTAVSLSLTTTAPTAADTVVTALVKTSAGTAAGGAQSITAAANKTFRLMAISGQIRATAATLPWCEVILHMSTTTTCTAASSVVAYLTMGGTAAAIGNVGQTTISWDDGWELSSGGSFCISVSGNVNTNVLTFSGQGYEY